MKSIEDFGGKEKINLDPDHNFPIPEDLRGITEEEVLSVAFEINASLMRRLRKKGKEDGEAIRYGIEPVVFQLPALGEPGRVQSLISLSTKGCVFSHRGECSFCAYGESKFNREEVMKSLPGQVDNAFKVFEKENAGYQKDENGEWQLVKEGGYKNGFINLTALGSFLDTREIPDDILFDVVDRIAGMIKSGDFPDGFEWTTESRPELLTKEVGEKLKTAFGKHGLVIGKDIILGIGWGLESSNPLIVQGAMGKKVTVPNEETVALMREYGLSSTAHTLFKPPFLTESESVEDVVNTVRHASEKNLYELMIVMTMNKRPSTAVDELSNMGMYKLPSIWSVAEIMNRLGSEICSKTQFFGFSVGSKQAETVTPKDEEEKQLMELILAFGGLKKEWEEIVDFLNNAQGKNKKEWEELMKNKPNSSLQERIAAGLDMLGKQSVGKGFKELSVEVHERQERLKAKK